MAMKKDAKTERKPKREYIKGCDQISSYECSKHDNCYECSKHDNCYECWEHWPESEVDTNDNA